MTDSFKYDNTYRKSGTGTKRNDTFHQLNHADNRINTFIIKKIDEDFHEISDEKEKFSISIEYPTDIRIKEGTISLSYSTSGGKRHSNLSDVNYGSNVELTIVDSQNREYVLDVDGVCSNNISGKTIRIYNVKSNISIGLRIKTNENYSVTFTIPSVAHVNKVTINSQEYTPPASGQYSVPLQLPKNNYTSLDYSIVCDEGYEVESIDVSSNVSLSESEISRLTSRSGEVYSLNFIDSILTYYVEISVRQKIVDPYVVKVKIDDPSKIDYFTIQSDRVNAPNQSEYTYEFSNSLSSCSFVLYSNGTKLDTATLDGVSKTVYNSQHTSFAVTFNPSKRGSSTPYIINISTISNEEQYSIMLMGIEHATIQYRYDGLTDRVDCIKIPDIDDYISVVECNASQIAFYIVLDNGYKMKTNPYCVIGEPTLGYTEGSNENVLLITGITEGLIVQFVIGEIGSSEPEDWLPATRAFGPNWSFVNSVYKTRTKIATVFTTTHFICFQNESRASYRFTFSDDSLIPSSVRVKVSDSLATISETAVKGYETLNVTANNNVIIVDNLDIGLLFPNGGKYIYFGFVNYTNFDSEHQYVEVSVDYLQGLGEDADIEVSPADYAYFNETDILSLSIIDEVDLSAKKIPYSSCSFTIKDEEDAYNPAVTGNRTSFFEKNQLFEVYSLVGALDFSEGIIPDIEKYITKVGTYRLDDVSQNNYTAKFNFIGALEYYDDKYLSDNEKFLSSSIKKIPAKTYLQRIFGSDVDVSAFRDSQLITTPFTSESKAEIARMIAERYSMYLYETPEGLISFMPLSQRTFALNNNQPFKLNLGKQRSNPEFRKSNEPIDSVKVNIKKVVLSEPTEISLSNCAIFVYIKDINEDEVGNEFDDGSNMDGYYLAMQRKANADDFLDEYGNVVDFGQGNYFLTNAQNPKYVRIRIVFDENYSIDNFISNCYLLGNKCHNKDSMNFDDFLYNICLFDLENSTNNKCIGATLTESTLDVWATYRGNIAGKNYYNNIYSDDLEELEYERTIQAFFFALYFNFVMMLTTVTSKKIDIIDSSYIYAPLRTMNNTYEVDNPLVTSKTDAEQMSMYTYIVKNRSIYESECSWRGDCSLKCGDEVLTAVPIGRGTEKLCENFYAGTVIKNGIDYSGSLKETTIVSIEKQEFYENEVSRANQPKLSKALPIVI